MIKKIVFFASLIILVGTLSMAQVWKAPDQEKAKQRAKQRVKFVEEYKDQDIVLHKMALIEKGISLDDIKDNYFLLDSPIIKEREDHYGPVRFAHKRHAALINDCTKCHHYQPKDESMPATTRCSACHQDSFNADHPERIGLKAALHQQCTKCHQEEKHGPVTCTGCHLKNVPDHKKLVKLPDNASPFQVTAECLRCHDQAGEEMLKTAHWNWRGPSPYTVKHRKEVQHGKGTTALNNY